MKDSKLYSVLKVIAIPIFYLFFRFRKHGLENLPEKGKIILASNHMSNFDPIFLGLASKRQLYFMSKAEMFKNPILRKFFTTMHSFPVKRGERDVRAINYAEKIIESGNVLAMFPEGTRSRTGELLPPKAGVAMLAHTCKCDILPVSVYCKGKVLPFKRYTVRFGEVIPYETLGISEGKPSEYKKAAKKIMDHIRSLWSEGHCK